MGVHVVRVGGEVVKVTLAAQGEEDEDHAEEDDHAQGGEAGAEGAHEEEPNPILPEPNEIIWGSLSFLVVLFFLAKFGYPAIKKAMDARAQRIQDSLDEADRARTEAEQVLADYRRQLADAKAEAGRIIEEARQSADAMRRNLETQAQQDIADMRARAQADIQAATDQAVADLTARVAEIAIAAAEKVVSANLDREANVRLIEEYINQVGRGAPT
jgi:F-type H+-transporting ATPase subunit b